MWIRVERSGGFAGVRLTFEIDLDVIPAAEARALENLVANAGFFKLPGKVSAGGLDRFVYRVTIEAAGRVHTVEIPEQALTETLGRLVARVRALADGRASAPRRNDHRNRE